MMLITQIRRNGDVDIRIVLADENIDRIRKYDPAEFFWRSMPRDICMRRPNSIAILYASAEELSQIEEMAATDPEWKAKALKMLSRGFEFRPDKGDHDFGPIVLGEPTHGTKQ